MERLNEFNSQNFLVEPNFDNFIDLIGGDQFIDPVANFCLNYDYDQISGLLDNTQFGQIPGDNFLGDFNFSSTLGGLPLAEENEIGEESSATTTTNTTTLPRKGDRSRTLIAERRRRGKMKDKLYALRALVPNITRMDKASIVGDAVVYVQELQMQAKKLRAEIAGLESSLTEGDIRQKEITEHQNNLRFSKISQLQCKTLLQMAAFQVEERGLYVKMESKRGQGVAVPLYKALESLTRFNIQTSNLATHEDKFILTFTLKVPENEPTINLENLKLWVIRAFENQGFEIQALQSG